MTSASTSPGAAAPSPEGKNRYKDTLNLPRTSFPMKANLVRNEPASLKRWGSQNVYARLRQERAGKPRFVFHDGPPYANGSIHLGHLMNKCLKDMVVRSRTMMGFDVPYVPGWDCHGLPIEHKVMTDLVESGKIEKLKTLDHWTRYQAIRRECQKHAEKFVKLQSGQFQRLLTIGDYEHPYLTMDPAYEAATLEALQSLLVRGLVYRALKPVQWSVANETALAEAELEYYDREDLSVYVDFEAADGGAVYEAFGLKEEVEDRNAENAEESEELEGVNAGGEQEGEISRAPKPGTRLSQRPCFMIWTTTPWTLPANLAIAVNPKFEYALAWVDGNVTVLAAEAVERVTKAAKAEEVVVLATVKGEKLVGLRYRHPFVDVEKGEGVGAPLAGGERHTGGTPVPPGRESPDLRAVFSVVDAEYVTLEDGTGLVHTAPGHGVEDYQTGMRIGLPIYCPVKGDGTYDASVPEWLRGKNIWDANAAVVQHLRSSGHLFYDHKFTHSYPHDWRSKTPTIFRCTEQWFVAVDRPYSVEGDGARSLRDRALAATDGGGVGFVPDWGRNRLRGMLEARPDWCISRQRAWGMPIPAFVMPDGSAFMTVRSLSAVIDIVKAKGTDCWFTMTPEQLLAAYDAKNDPDAPESVRRGEVALSALKKGGDILDVWFESGTSWNAVVRARGLGYPADLYLEGSDQHRGWFQLSLLPALGVTGRPPFRTILTHGFMVDRDGKKLSKSRPDAHRYEVDSLCTEFGMDVMRWWVASLAYENDIKVDVELFALAGESYRKVRNTLRFMLSNVDDYRPCSAPPGSGRPAPTCGIDCVAFSEFKPTDIDAWALAEFDRLSRTVIDALNRYDFQTANKAIYDFCNDTLSATYLAAVKDRLYCDQKESFRRRRARTTLFDLTDGLCRLLAPVLCHTADEAWRTLWKVAQDDPSCIHTVPAITADTRSVAEGGTPGYGVNADARWPLVHQRLDEARIALEQAKGAMGVDNPLDAGVVLPDADGVLDAFDPVDLADLLGVSRVSLDRFAVAPKVVDLRSEPRCDRSWKRDGTVRRRSDGGLLSQRDAQAVGLV